MSNLGDRGQDSTSGSLMCLGIQDLSIFLLLHPRLKKERKKERKEKKMLTWNSDLWSLGVNILGIFETIVRQKKEEILEKHLSSC